ncbi:MAG: Helix-turn-helix domain [Candidatus Peribacteria bacterium]|nr:Helix-turn-helix domain [Candidatus Peribacteria bacterium]
MDLVKDLKRRGQERNSERGICGAFSAPVVIGTIPRIPASAGRPPASDKLKLLSQKGAILLDAISNEVRAAILLQLSAEQSMMTLAAKLRMNQATVAEHVKTLCSNGLVSRTRHGGKRIYALTDKGREIVKAYIILGSLPK